MTMRGILSFIVGVIWGSLSAQFLVQVVTSLIVVFVYLAGVALSKVSRAMNFAGALAGVGQTLIFGILFFVGNWITSEYIIDYDTWNLGSIAALLAFLGTIIYCARQVPGKIVLAKMCAWTPNFMEASMRVPPAERIALARRWRLESQH
jgi:hypothetical protein